MVSPPKREILTDSRCDRARYNRIGRASALISDIREWLALRSFNAPCEAVKGLSQILILIKICAPWQVMSNVFCKKMVNLG